MCEGESKMNKKCPFVQEAFIRIKNSLISVSFASRPMLILECCA